MPGCRSTRCLEIHHIVPRSLGGTNDPENLILNCDGCHTAHHRGLITIKGTASELVVSRRHEVSYDQEAWNDESNDPSQGARSEHVVIRRHEVANDQREADDESSNQSQGTLSEHVVIGRYEVANDPLEADSEPAHDQLARDQAAHDHAARDQDQQADVHSSSGKDVAAALASVAPANTCEVSSANTSRPIEPSAHVGTNFLQQRDAASAQAPSRRFERERMRVEARTALTGLGYRPAEAGKAVNLALERLGATAALEDIIREALRCCCRR